MIKSGLFQRNPRHQLSNWEYDYTTRPFVASKEFDIGFQGINATTAEMLSRSVSKPFKNDMTPKLAYTFIFQPTVFSDLFGSNDGTYSAEKIKNSINPQRSGVVPKETSQPVIKTPQEQEQEQEPEPIENDQDITIVKNLIEATPKLSGEKIENMLTLVDKLDSKNGIDEELKRIIEALKYYLKIVKEYEKITNYKRRQDFLDDLTKNDLKAIYYLLQNDEILYRMLAEEMNANSLNYDKYQHTLRVDLSEELDQIFRYFKMKRRIGNLDKNILSKNKKPFDEQQSRKRRKISEEVPVQVAVPRRSRILPPRINTDVPKVKGPQVRKTKITQPIGIPTRFSERQRQ